MHYNGALWKNEKTQDVKRSCRIANPPFLSTSKFETAPIQWINFVELSFFRTFKANLINFIVIVKE